MFQTRTWQRHFSPPFLFRTLSNRSVLSKSSRIKPFFIGGESTSLVLFFFFFFLPRVSRNTSKRKRIGGDHERLPSFFPFFFFRAIVIFRASSGLYRTTVQFSREYRLPPPFKRENIDIRGGFFSLNSGPARPPERVRCFRSRVRRPEHTGSTRWCDVSASSKIREKPIRRGSASRM